MYAIRSKRSQRWYAGVDPHAGMGSSHRIHMSNVPLLFESENIARIELLVHQMQLSAFDIVEVHLTIQEHTH